MDAIRYDFISILFAQFYSLNFAFCRLFLSLFLHISHEGHTGCGMWHRQGEVAYGPIDRAGK